MMFLDTIRWRYHRLKTHETPGSSWTETRWLVQRQPRPLRSGFVGEISGKCIPKNVSAQLHLVNVQGGCKCHIWHMTWLSYIADDHWVGLVALSGWRRSLEIGADRSAFAKVLLGDPWSKQIHLWLPHYVKKKVKLNRTSKSHYFMHFLFFILQIFLKKMGVWSCKVPFPIWTCLDHDSYDRHC